MSVKPAATPGTSAPVAALLERSNRSARTRATRTTPAATPRPRAPAIDPVTGTPVELLWVKGSGRRPRAR